MLRVVENCVGGGDKVRPNLIASPVLRLRSKRGKLLLEISKRIE